MKLLPLLVAALLAGCAATSVPPLASGRMTSDLATYPLRRVGLLPPTGLRLEGTQGADIQAACYAEFSAGAAFEVVRWRLRPGSSTRR